MSPLKQKLVLLAAMGVMLGLAVLVLELAFGQWFGSDPWSEVERMNVVRNRAVSYDVRHIHGPEAAPVRYTRDRYGLRASCREPREVRVVTLGGSTTDQVYLDDTQTWQAVLERKLGELGAPACIANAGVDGHTSFGHIAALERWLPLVPELKPDYVLLYMGINDGALRVERGYADEQADAGAWARLKTAIRNRSALAALWRVLRSRTAQQQDGHAIFAAHKLLMPTDVHYSARETAADIDTLTARSATAFRARLHRILALVRERGAVPLCVSQPSIVYRRFDDGWRGIPDTFRFEGRSFNGLDFRRSILEINRVMADECPRAGGHYIDLERRAFEPADYYDAAHMNARGAQKVGAYLFEELVAQRVAERWKRAR